MVTLIDKHPRHGQTVTEEWLIDTDAELKDLPKAPAGSFAVSAETGTKFYADSNGDWPVKE